MFLDAALATLSLYGVASLFDMNITWELLLLSRLFVYIPDSDVLWPAISRYVYKKERINHRTWLHYPVLHIGVALVISFVSLPIGVLYGVTTFLHFVHDTFFLGWGVVWLWPIKKTRYKCFPDRDGKITSVPLTTWEEKDEESLMKQYHNPDWIRDFYLRPGIVAYIEYTAFFLALFFVCRSLLL